MIFFWLFLSNYKYEFFLKKFTKKISRAYEKQLQCKDVDIKKKLKIVKEMTTSIQK